MNFNDLVEYGQYLKDERARERDEALQRAGARASEALRDAVVEATALLDLIIADDDVSSDVCTKVRATLEAKNERISSDIGSPLGTLEASVRECAPALTRALLAIEHETLRAAVTRLYDNDPGDGRRLPARPLGWSFNDALEHFLREKKWALVRHSGVLSMRRSARSQLKMAFAERIVNKMDDPMSMEVFANWKRARE